MIKEEDLVLLGFNEYPSDRWIWWKDYPAMIIDTVVLNQLNGELHIEDEVNGMTEDTLLSIVNSKEELEQVLETLLI